LSDSQVLEKLSQLLGSKGFTSDPDDLAPWTTDWRGRYHGQAAALLSPATTAEVSEIIKIANAHQLTLVPQGGTVEWWQAPRLMKAAQVVFYRYAG